jgi:hypothetical protein
MDIRVDISPAVLRRRPLPAALAIALAHQLVQPLGPRAAWTLCTPWGQSLHPCELPDTCSVTHWQATARDAAASVELEKVENT